MPAKLRKGEPVPERHAEMVHELERSSAGAALLAVDHNEIRIDIGREHGLADGEEFPTDVRCRARTRRACHRKACAEPDQLDGRGECGMACRGNAVFSKRHAACRGNLGRYFGRRQHPAMPRLGALAQLVADQFDLIACCPCGELLQTEAAVGGTAAEIARADFPDDVAAHLAMVRAEAAFPGVVGKGPNPCAGVERAGRIFSSRKRRCVRSGSCAGSRAASG